MASPTRHDSDSSSTTGKRWRRPAALIAAFSASLLGLGALSQVAASPLAHAAGTATVSTWSDLRAAMSDTTVDTIDLSANVQRTAGATTAATDLPAFGRDLTIDGHGFSLDFRPGGVQTVIARSGILLTPSATASFTLKDINIIRPNGGAYSLVSYATTAASNIAGTAPVNNTQNWTVNFSDVSAPTSAGLAPSSGLVTLPGGTVNITDAVTWDSSNGTNPATVVVNARVVNVSGASTDVTFRNHSASGDTVGDMATLQANASGRTNAVNVSDGAHVTIENLGQGSTQAVNMDIGTTAGTNTQFNVSGAGTVLDVLGWGNGTGVTGGTLIMQAAPTTTGSSGFKITDGAVMNVHAQVPSNRNTGAYGMPALLQQVNGGLFLVDGEGTQLNVQADGAGNALAGAIRIRAVGNQTLEVSNLATLNVYRPLRNGGGNTAAAIRFGTATNNAFVVTSGGVVNVENDGNGNVATSDSSGNNGAVEFAANYWSFEVSGSGTWTTGPDAGQTRPSAVQLIAKNGAAVSAGGQNYGSIDMTDGSVFVANGNVNSTSNGIFGTGNNFSFTSDSPQYYDFANTNPRVGALVFDTVGAACTYTQTNSDIAVWGNGTSRVGGAANATNSSDNLIAGNPYMSWTLVDLALRGANFVTMASSSDASLDTTVGSFGTTGMSSWRRISGNNAPPTIRTMEAPTNADLYVRGTGTVAEGLIFSGRPIWDDEVFSRWQITDPHGNVTTSTAGQSSSVQSEDLYTTETGVKTLYGTVRYSDGNLLTTGTQYELTQAWRGSIDDPTSTKIHPSASTDILTNAVTVTDVLPPVPAVVLSPIAAILIGSGDVSVSGTWSNAAAQAAAQPNNPDPAVKLEAVLNTASNVIADCTAGLNSDGTWTCDLPDSVTSTLTTGDKVFFVLTDLLGNANPLVATPIHDTTMEPAPYLTASNANIVANDFTMTAHDATMVMSASNRDAQLIAAAHAEATHLGDAVEVTSVGIPNPATPGVYPVTFQISGAPADETNTVTVNATITENPFSYTNSTFTVDPTVSMADNSTWKVADGVQYYTGIFTAKDTYGGLISDLAVSDIVFTSSPQTNITGVVNHHDGTYTVQYSTTVADDGYTGSMTYKGTQVGVRLPIPFKAGPVCVSEAGDTCSSDPDLQTRVAVTVDWAAADDTATDEVTGYAYDKNGNPVDSAVFTIATTDTGLHLASPSTITTNQDGMGTLTATSATAGPHTATASINGTELTSHGSPLTLNFTAGEVEPGTLCTVEDTDNGSLNPTEWVVGQVYANPLSVSLADTPPLSTLTVLMADANCNPVEGAIVDMTANATPPETATPSATFNGNPATSDSDGFASATISDSASETVTIRGTYDASNATNNGVAGDYGSGNLWPSTDTPPTDVVSFTVDSVDTNALCVVRVDGVDYTVQSGQVYPYPFAQDATSTADPKMPLMSASLAAGGNQSVRTYLFDKACNPVPDYSVTFVGVPAMQPDGATPTTSTVQGTTDSGGMATGSVTDKKAETVNVGGTYASPDVPPSDTGSLSAAAITFTAGDADTCTVTGECQCADSADTATNLSVSAPSAHIPGTILATAHVTDRYCNVVADNFPVIFSVSTKPGQTPPAGTGTPFVGAGATVGTTNGVTVTTVNGNATATVSDSTPEFVNVSAAIITSMTSPPSLPVPIDKAPQTVEFTVGDVNSDSSFTCTPTSSSTETPTIPVANGTVATDNWTCVVHAVDNNNNPLLTLDVTKFNFAQSTNTANQTTPVVNSGGGDYTVKFYSKTADANNAVMATYNGVSVGDPATVVPIHFKADQVAPDTECPANGKTYKVAQVYADPNTIGVRGTASLTVLLADANCNPITGATVTYTTNLNAVIPGATTPATVNPATTNADGLAMSSVMDSTAETVTIGGTYDASNATSNGIVGNYGSGSLTSDTTSLGGTAPAPTGTSMVEFAAGDVAPDVECTVTVMPENISATVKVAQVYSGNAPWKADGTATDGSSSVYADGTSSVVLRTWLLDGDCNPVPGATATFAGTPSTPSVITPATAASADSTGMAKASITDTKAETVTVGGTYANTTTADHGNLASTTATFNSGAFDPTKSVFVVTPAVDPTSASKTNWVVADGTTPYSGYVAAYDAAGNPVTDMSATDFVYTVTGVPTGAPDVKVTIGAKSGNRYYVTFTTTYAAATYTVTAASVANPTAKVTGSNATDGTTVTTWSNGTAVAAGAGGAPIPFQAGAATGGGDTPIQCSDGRDKSWIGVSSPSQAAGTPATVTVHLTDINCNPVANASVSFTPTGNAKMTPAVATTDAQGVATSDVNNYTAQTVQITANSGAAVVGPVTTVFTAGDPAVDTDCTNNALYKQGTQLTVGSTMVQLSGTTPGSTSVDAFITDQYCNPITFDTSVAGAHGINVNLSVSPVLDGSGAAATTDSAYLNTAGTKNTTIVTDATGHATATLFDTTAETVNVKANLSASQLIKPVAGINVVFATGDFDSNDSSFTCVNTPGSAFPIPVANGTDSYTCTIDAMDNTGAALPNLGTGNFAFAVTSGTPGTTTNLVSHSTVTNNGNGTYTVKFTTLTSDSTYKVTASYAGQPITGGFTIVPTPIPFTFGAPIPPDPINPTCADSRYKTNTRAVPTTQEAGTPSVVTTLVTDKDCNPVVGTTVSWALSSTTASVDSPSRTTASDGTASTNLNDRVAEYVQVSAVANGAGATNLNAGSASVTFTAGPPVPGPVTNCPTVAMTGSNVTAASPITVGGTSTVTAKVTDANCNPVTTPVVVTFAITSPSGTATISTTPGSVTASTVNGIATARATNNTAETAKVAAQITQGYLYAPAGSASDSPSTHTQAPIVFQADVFNGGMSTFVCVLTPGSAMPPVADGVQSYTCTITAKDISGNGLTTTDPNYPINPASFEFAMSPFITPSTVTEVSATTAPGQYKVTFTTLKSDPNYTVSVTYNGIPIDAVPTVLPTPIPFQSGAPIPPDPNNPKCTSGPNTGAPKTFTYAAPTSTQVGDPYSMTVGSLITTYVTDAQCNPVVGATV
ncbi:MAG: Ig-like domain-containing protein, partial [Propionibacteriaceae bacterium]|nr:Ig-like domain-containing protein [Propionibacteriaceae bacterium]